MYKLEDIKTIHLEVTQRCQAACPMCDRNMNGQGINPHINLAELTLDDCRYIFTPKFIQQLDTMYMCGNLGDPIIANETLEIFDYFRYYNENMWLSMNTNGGARTTDWWTQLAKIYGKHGAVIFSVDGLSDTNQMYRQGVVWDKVMNSMESFIAAGGRARWDYLVFEHNQHQVNEARSLSTKMGFEQFRAKKTGRFISEQNGPITEYQSKDQKGKDSSILKKPEVEFQNQSLQNQSILLEKYGTMDQYYDVVPIQCKVKDIGSLFITSEGIALPCCWTAGRMYKWWHKDPKIEQIWKFIDNAGGKELLNARHGLEYVFDTGIFAQIEESWAVKSCSNGRLKVCAMKCGIEFDPFGDQFR